MPEKQLTIRFWGTRGTTLPRVPSTKYGIHTTCVECIPTDGAPFLFDLGTGAIPGGQSFIDRGVHDVDVFFTHLHSDHVFGIFGFPPLYNPHCNVRLHAVREGISEELNTLFANPFHPLNLDQAPASIDAVQLVTDGQMERGDGLLTLRWRGIPHPQGCTAYRIDDGTNAVVFCTDVELARTNALGGLYDLLTQPYPAGAVIVDGFFAPAEIDRFTGWGHSTWREACTLAENAGGIDTVLITHHHPARTDSELDELAGEAGAAACWVRDNDLWTLTGNHMTMSDATLRGD